MLRILFVVLLLINGGLFAYQNGYLDDLFPSTREPTRLKQQLNPDKLTVLPAADPVATAVATKSAASSTSSALSTPTDSASAPAVSPPAIATAATSATAATTVPTCTEIGSFDEADVKKFEAQLTLVALNDRATRRVVQEATRHIVYIPSMGSKDAADKKGAELKRLGVADFFVIQDNTPLQWGISLGVFKTEEAARKHLAELSQQGVRSARVGTFGARFAFQLRGLDAAAQANLQKIREGYPRQEARSCS